METTELVFDVINKLSNPVILFEKAQTNKWSQRYLNQAVEKLLSQKSDEEEKKAELSKAEKPATNWKYETSLQVLIDNYNEEERPDSYMLHDIEIFDGIYNVHFNHNQDHLLIIFIQIPLKELFDNITFHDLSETCSSIMVVLDSSGKIIDMNECFLNLVEMKKESVLGKKFLKTFMPTSVEQLNPYLKDIASKDVYIHHFVTPLTASNDRHYQINWQISKIIKSKQTYIIAVGSNISKFIEKNSDLKRELASIKIGFDYFPLAIGYMNTSGRFTTTNPRFKKIFHIAKEDETIMFDQIKSLADHTSFNKIK
ncbi:MAG: PAS domain S-box protein, partial [Sulfurimonas sp.]|nr:PAS domain S-box protein [Sulfurimonas sp.]